LEAIYHAGSEKANEIKEMLLKDEVASKASIILKDARILTGEEGSYVWIVGTEEQLRRVSELVGEDARLLEGEEYENVLRKLKEEAERTLAGFGGLFG